MSAVARERSFLGHTKEAPTFVNYISGCFQWSSKRAIWRRILGAKAAYFLSCFLSIFQPIAGQMPVCHSLKSTYLRGAFLNLGDACFSECSGPYFSFFYPE